MDGYVHHSRTSAGPGSGFFLGGCGCGRRRIRVPMLLGDLILARINIVVPKEVTGATKAQHDK